MRVISFEYSARFGHFARAETSSNALSYPVPPRTSLLGLIGAVLGLAKDDPQQVLDDARIAVGGPIPRQHWHKANIRKDPPSPLPYVITCKEKGSSHPECNTRIPQQWLLSPHYLVWISLAEKYLNDLASRLKERRWHFTPSMGLSEMMADLSTVGEMEAKPLPKGRYGVVSVVLESAGSVDLPQACSDNLAIHSLRMPRSVSADRVFTHDNYRLERDGRPLPFHTEHAWQAGDKVILFL